MTDALIVGGGIGGLATAVALARNGIDVRLIERHEAIRPLGSGITLIGPAVRALHRLGVLDDCLDCGHPTGELVICDPAGAQIARTVLPSALPGAPGLLGMTRPDLHRILLGAARQQGVEISTGRTPRSVEHLDGRARITLDDAEVVEAAVLIGADGLRSTVRRMVFGEYHPVFRDQVCIRALLPRHPAIDQEFQFHGVPRTHIGFTPISRDQMYLYCCVPVENTDRPDPAALPRLVTDHLMPYGGLVARIREGIDAATPINYAPLETIVAPPPWHHGSVVLVGDAAHATTPQLAAGGAMCLEDALVLAEELSRHPTVEPALAAYTERRFDRCRYVVDSSVQLSAWQIQPQTPDEKQRLLVGEAVEILAGEY